MQQHVKRGRGPALDLLRTSRAVCESLVLRVGTESRSETGQRQPQECKRVGARATVTGRGEHFAVRKLHNGKREFGLDNFMQEQLLMSESDHPVCPLQLPIALTRPPTFDMHLHLRTSDSARSGR